MKAEDIVKSAKEEIMNILHEGLGQSQDTVFPYFGLNSHELEYGVIDYDGDEKAFLVETKYDAPGGEEKAFLKVNLSLVKI